MKISSLALLQDKSEGQVVYSCLQFVGTVRSLKKGLLHSPCFYKGGSPSMESAIVHDSDNLLYVHANNDEQREWLSCNRMLKG